MYVRSGCGPFELAGLSGNQALDHVHDVLGKKLDSIPLSRIWRLLHVPSFIPPSRK